MGGLDPCCGGEKREPDLQKTGTNMIVRIFFSHFIGSNKLYTIPVIAFLRDPCSEIFRKWNFY